MTSITRRKAELEARLGLLQGRLQGLEAELDGHEETDWEERAVEREGDEVLERLGQDGQAEIRRIEAALKRIAAGEYGRCSKCGAEIGAARLDAVPETPHCKDCAA